MRKNMFDVVVVGGGPAGATAAYCLASMGVNVAILDKATFPRDKACGGGLQGKVLRHLPVDAKPVIRNSMYGICFTYRLGERFTRLYDEPVAYGTLRREFDSYLVEQAKRKGTIVIEGACVDGFEQKSQGKVEVSSNVGSFLCRVLIGADGANGVVRRALNNEQAFFNQAGLYFDIEREKIVEEQFDNRVMRVDWGTLPSGYAWIFPKTDFVNIGVGAPVALGKRLKQYLHDFLAKEEILKSPRIDFEDLNVSGHKLPTFTQKTKLVEGNVVVIGDAAGLIEPFTGDGISYGVHSARLAADIVYRWLEGTCSDLSEYPDAVLREIVPEIRYSRKLMTFFNTFPRMIHEVFRRNDKVWQAFGRVLKGEESYDIFRRKKMGRLYCLWNYIDWFTLYYETKKLDKPDTSETLFQRLVRLIVGSIIQRI